MKIDIYSHICPKEFIDYFSKHVMDLEKLTGVDKLAVTRPLWDIDKRLEIMENYEDYVQILVPTQPAAETFCSPEQSPEVARVYNDAMAEIISKYPNKFVGAVAYLPLNNLDGTLKEIDRTINELGFKGILMNTPIFRLKKQGEPSYGYDYENMKPIDLPEFMPIYEVMSNYKLPIWIHPKGEGGIPSYHGEEMNRYGLSRVLGWPIESAMAMCRLVCSGITARYPDLRFITHHCGSIIPTLAGRLESLQYSVQSRDKEKEKTEIADIFQFKSPADYFRMFYADTATNGNAATLMLGYDFFGVEHILFGTDSTFGKENGELYLRQTIDAVYRMNVSDADKEEIFAGNARRLLRLG